MLDLATTGLLGTGCGDENQTWRKSGNPEMLLLTGIWICWIVISPGIRGEDTCNLYPSELGPDWYKVIQPVPPGFEDIMEPSFIHMPCAVTTVFDVGICGCTNLMSFIHTSYKDKVATPQSDPEHAMETLEDSDDVVKFRDPADSAPVTPRTPVGSRILNTRTGEFTDCPFRSSSRGNEWYLVREPTDTWRPMKCSDGTLFEKRACTCVHEAVASRQPLRPEDSDLIVLEEVYEEDEHSEGKISKSLGISVSDVDFSGGRNPDVPFWRRNNDFNIPENTLNISPPSSDVHVTLLGNGFDAFGSHDFIPRPSDVISGEFPVGRHDAISDTHRKLLQKLEAGPVPFHQQAAPMYIDNPEHIQSKQTNDSLIFKPVLDTVPHNGGLVRKDAPEETINGGNNVMSGDVTNANVPTPEGATVISEKDEKLTEIQNILNLLNDNIRGDEIFSAAECNKKPLRDLGPQYFLLYVFGAGYVPFACHGSRIYNDKKCACVPAPAQSFIDEVNLPKPAKCNKRALPDIGPAYFERYLWGVGAVPYACHGGTIFSQPQCACVLPNNIQ